jgi:flagellar biogenesis protein FliO
MFIESMFMRSGTAQTLHASAGGLRERSLGLWERIKRLVRREPRRLRLCESLPLGERRFVAVVEFDAARFLVGGTASSLVLLSRLEDAGGPVHHEDRKKEDRKLGDETC